MNTQRGRQTNSQKHNYLVDVGIMNNRPTLKNVNCKEFLMLSQNASEELP